MTSDAAAGTATRSDDGPGARIRSIDRALRRSRALLGILLIGLALTGRPDDGPALGSTPSLLIVGFLVLANVASLLAERARDDTERRLVLLQLVVDLGTGAAAVVVAGVDNGAAWAILLLPVLHAGLRYQLTGVITAWALALGIFLTRAAMSWDPALGPAQLEVVIQPLAVLLIVGITVGYLAGQLTEEILDQRANRLEASERTSLLAVVTAASRKMTRLDPPVIAEAAGEALLRLGYGAVDLWQRSTDDRWSLLTACGDTTELDRLGPPGPGALSALEAADSRIDRDHGVDPDRTVLLMPFPFTGIVVRAVATDDRYRWAPRLQATDILMAHAGHAFGMCRRVSELEAMRADLAHKATHDTLTGLLNRAGLMAVLDDELARLGGDRILPVMLVDLDGFKSVNDRFGHEAGDAVLREMAAQISMSAPPGSAPARLGGDEFVLVFPSIPRDGTERSRLEILRVELERSLHVTSGPGATDGSGETLVVTGSVGAHPAVTGETTDEAIAAADASMYRAKEQRRSLRGSSR